MDNYSHFWDEHLSVLDGIVKVGDDWANSQTLEKTLKNIKSSLGDDIDALQRDARFIFSTLHGLDEQTEQNVDLLRRWHCFGEGPSMTALCIFAAENMGLELTEEYSRALILASYLGEVEHNNPYHNNMHFKKVFLQIVRMIVMHNEIYESMPYALEDKDVALMLIAACIHDLGHDGKGNTVKGVIQPGRLEKRSFDLARPYLDMVGFNDETALEYIRVMLLGTDTAPLDDPSSYMNQMKAAYRYHFLGEHTKTHTLNLDSEIACLQRDKKLSMMSLILHEADIATSAGLTYEMTKYETSIFMMELKGEEAYPQQILDFLNQICQRKFISDAGQRLYASNFARIHAMAEEDVKNGNEPLPKPELSEFIVTYGGGGEGDSSRTIN